MPTELQLEETAPWKQRFRVEAILGTRIDDEVLRYFLENLPASRVIVKL
jgi:hypothetical protein